MLIYTDSKRRHFAFEHIGQLDLVQHTTYRSGATGTKIQHARLIIITQLVQRILGKIITTIARAMILDNLQSQQVERGLVHGGAEQHHETVAPHDTHSRREGVIKQSSLVGTNLLYKRHLGQLFSDGLTLTIRTHNTIQVLGIESAWCMYQMVQLQPYNECGSKHGYRNHALQDDKQTSQHHF